MDVLLVQAPCPRGPGDRQLLFLRLRGKRGEWQPPVTSFQRRMKSGRPEGNSEFSVTPVYVCSPQSVAALGHPQGLKDCSAEETRKRHWVGLPTGSSGC